ncbi:MAG: DUF3180 family protein [Candidatus Ancillula sp.]|jgi:MFS family permease|nr:DUF3180 family protein [Candidatus Ancillula sp.]
MRNFIIILVLVFSASSILSFWSISHAQTPLLRGNISGAICVLVLSIMTFVAGFWVSKYKKTKKSLIEVHRAYRIVCLANSSIFTGGLLFTIWLGTLLGEFQIWQVLDYKVFFELLAVISAVVLTLSGVFTISRSKVDGSEEKGAGIEA